VFKTQHEYQQHLAKERGFKSEYEYRQYLTKKKQKRLENIELSNLIKRNLKKLGKEQNWLAEKLGVTKGTVSKYASGTYIPNYERLQKLFKVLKLPYKTIDDILE
jgi:ribosome-binding protein aMBF1 (putative translation factor)